MTGSRIKRNCLGKAPDLIKKSCATRYITPSFLSSVGPGKKESSLYSTYSSIQVVYWREIFKLCDFSSSITYENIIHSISYQSLSLLFMTPKKSSVFFLGKNKILMENKSTFSSSCFGFIIFGRVQEVYGTRSIMRKIGDHISQKWGKWSHWEKKAMKILDCEKTLASSVSLFTRTTLSYSSKKAHYVIHICAYIHNIHIQ